MTAHKLEQTIVVEHNHIYLPPEYLLHIAEFAQSHIVAVVYHRLHTVATHAHHAAIAAYHIGHIDRPHYLVVGKEARTRHCTCGNIDIVDGCAYECVLILVAAEYGCGGRNIAILGEGYIRALHHPLLRHAEVHHQAIYKRVVDGQFTI